MAQILTAHGQTEIMQNIEIWVGKWRHPLFHFILREV